MNSDKLKIFPPNDGIGEFIRAYRDRLTALKKYGRHLSGCLKIIRGLECSCGWDDVSSQIETNDDIIKSGD